MDSGHVERRTRCLLVWLASTLALVLLLTWLCPDVWVGQWVSQSVSPTLGPTLGPSVGPSVGPSASTSFDRLLVRLCAAAASLVALWLWTLTTLVTAMAAWGCSPSRVPGIPSGWRRLVLAACGAALVGTGSPAVGAADDRAGQLPATVDHPVLHGLPYPDRTGPGAGPRCTTTQRVVVVRAGDTLWELARARLARGADDLAVTRAWQRLYTLNRSVVGDDPDLIHPHLRLRLPCRASAREELP